MKWKPHARLVIVGLLAGLAIATSAPAVAAKKKNTADRGPQGKIFGTVERDGSPVVGAVIYAYQLDTGRTYSSDPTDRGGKYEVGELPYGYYDLAVVTGDGVYPAGEVINLSPSGKAVVRMTLIDYDDRPESYWEEVRRREFLGELDPSNGVAEIRLRAKGVDFWKTGKGVAILSSIGGAALLAIAVTSDDETSAFLP